VAQPNHTGEVVNFKGQSVDRVNHAIIRSRRGCIEFGYQASHAAGSVSSSSDDPRRLQRHASDVRRHAWCAPHRAQRAPDRADQPSDLPLDLARPALPHAEQAT
jgi:hypothetical protein